MSEESYCEFCGDPSESMYHIFFSCPMARRFWGEVKQLTGVGVFNFHPCSWSTDVLKASVCPSTTAALMICGAWALWTRRNGRRHGRKIWELGAMARYISSLLESLASLKMLAAPRKQRQMQQWRPPDDGCVKLNTDAGFDAGNCTESTGVVIRDNFGRVVAAVARWFDGVPDALTAEALAAKEGIELAVELGLERVILEVDCLGLVNLLKDTEASRSSIGGLCFDIAELGNNFREFRVEWVRREANSVAHACACRVSSSERSFFWLDSIPDWLRVLAAGDCIPI